MFSVMGCCFGVILPVISFFSRKLNIFFISRRRAERGMSDYKLFFINANYLILMVK